MAITLSNLVFDKPRDLSHGECQHDYASDAKANDDHGKGRSLTGF